MNFIKSKGLLFAIFLAQVSFVNAQLLVNSGGSPEELADLLSGQGIEILNPQITCPTGGWGTYTANVPNFTGEEGLILATGLVTNALGPNTSESTTTNFGAPGNALLTAVSGFSTNDACMFEFDIIPQGDTIRFDFVFASEEYQEYVGTSFNDVFGFFISGPGIAGDPGLGNEKNIALIPGTNTPVTINNINNGNTNLNPDYPPTNPEFFQANPLNPNAAIEYDGWTINLQAVSAVTPCETYHLKLIIADASDPLWDSGVFIEKIESNNVQLSVTTAGGTQNIIEGCNDGIVTFTRQNVTNDPLEVEYFVQGTATNGLDYPLIGTDPDPLVPKYITIPANQASVSISIEAFDDGIDEGLEYLLFLIGNPQCDNAISDSLRIYIQDSLNVFIEPDLANICLGDGLTFSVDSGGTAFSWNPPDFLDDPNIKEPTASNVTNNITYTLTTTVSECVATGTATINTENVLITLTPQNLSCNGADDGSISSEVSGGLPAYTYSWIGPNGFTSASPNISGLVPGLYTLTVSDQNSCDGSASITITEPTPLSVNLESPEFSGGFNISCFEGTNGSITSEVNGGTAPYTYHWNDPSGQDTPNASNLTAGTYMVTVTDANDCQVSASITLTQPSAVTATILSSEQVLCHGGNSGSATAQGNGGVGNYTYSWNTVPPQFGAVATNLTAGFYTVTVTDANNCSANTTVEIEEPDTPISINTSKVDVDCFGASTGSATATAIGGTGNLTYSWNTNPVQTGPVATGLIAGTYIVTVQDENNCTSMANVTINQPQNALSLNITAQNDANCFGDATGSATVQATGGTPGYSYTWNTVPPQSGNSATNLSAGTYNVVVTDQNGCTTNTNVVIGEPDNPLSLEIVTQTDVNCFGQNTGAATVAASGGTPGYTYTWNTTPVTNGASISNIGAGEYIVTVQDDNGCTDQLTVNIIQPDEPLQANITNVQNVLCFGESTGSATASVSGGTPDYSYLWNDPLAQTTATATGLSAGSYSVQVTDANGCTGILNVTITQPATPLDASIVNQTNVLCFGNATGAATVQGTGGSGSYSYLWTPGGNTTGTVTGLLAGSYTVTVTDNNGCDIPVIVDVEITQPAEGLVADLTSPEVIGGWNIACHGDASGSIDLDVSGGSPPYSYTWYEANGDTTFTQNLSNVIAGTYTVIIADGSECTLEQSITLTQPDPIDYTFEMTPTLCFGSNEGEIKVEIFGGTPGYDYSWEGPDGFTSDQSDLFNLYGGIYELTVTDANGCVFYVPITVIQPEDIVISVEDISSFPGGWNVSCHDSEDGFIDISATGGTTPYNFVWQGPNNPFFSSNQNVADIPGGSYEVILIDSNNCIQNLFIELLTPDSISIDLNAFQFPGGAELSCVGASDGSITSVIEGGTPGYSYNWFGPSGFPGAISENLNNLPEGTYVLQITDENGCINQEAIRIDPPDSLIVEVSSPEFFGGYNISCNGADDGSIQLFISGGVPGYNVTWNGPNSYTSNDVNISGLEAGLYCATVSDENGCEEIICIELTEPEPLDASVNSASFQGGWNIDCNGNATGSIVTSVEGGVPPYFYFWDGPGFFSSNSPNISDLEAGEYCLSIFDGNTCTFDTCIVLTQPEPLSVALTASNQNGYGVSCTDASDGSITTTVNGGTADYTFEWSGPDGFTSTSPNIDNLSAGVYCVTVTDANGCETTNCTEITEPQPITINLTSPEFAGGFNISCFEASTGSINSSVNGGTPGYSYSWTGPNGYTSSSPNPSGLVAGVYCLEITDQNNCTELNCIELTQPSMLDASPVIAPVACNSSATGSIDLNMTGGTPPYSYVWSNGGDTENIGNLEAGAYSVVVIDANDCVFEASFEIEEPEDLQLALSSPTFVGGFNIDCNGNTTGSIGNNIVGGTDPYLYDWSGPDGFASNDSSLVGLSAGTYCLQVTDANGCEAEACITLTEPDVLNVNIAQTAEVLCDGASNGALQAQPSGGNPAYNYAWTGPNGYTASNQNISNLSAGVYCVTVTDANGCTSENCFEVTEPEVVDVLLEAEEFAGGYNINCYQGNDGNITATPSGGTGDYTYVWSGPNGFSADTPIISGLIAGEYCLMVFDENNCMAEACITLIQPDPLDVALTSPTFNGGNNISCLGACDGSLDATVTGGAGPFDFEWQGPNGFISSDTMLTDLCAGTYVLWTTDANNCVKVDSLTLVEPELLTLDLFSPTYGGGTNIVCLGDSTGGIFSTVTGGSPDYTYDWEGPGGFSSNASVLELLAAGTYYLSVTDLNGCSVSDSIVLTEPADSLYAFAEPFVYPGGTNISCYGASDGAIDLTVIGGIEPYTFNWSGGFNFDSDEQNISDLEHGEYVVIVLDANECTYTVEVTLTEPEAPLAIELGMDSVLCNGANDGSIVSEVTGGSPGYEYSWDGPDGYTSNSANPENLTAGTYNVLVTDTNGCTATSAITVMEPTAITITGEANDATCDAADGSIATTASGGTGTLTFEWDSGEQTSDIENLESGTYTLVVTDENGCTATTSYEVGGFNPLELELMGQNLLCHGDSTGEVSADLLNAVPPVNYNWNGPGDFQSGDPVLMNLGAGEYTLIVEDGNNCTITSSIVITQPDSLILDDLFSPYPTSGINYNVSAPGGSDGSILSLIFSGGTGEVTGEWYGPSGFEASGIGGLNGLEAGTYTVIITDENGCTATQSITLTEPYELELPNGISPNGDGFNDGLIIRGLELFPNNELIVFNRWGNIVYRENNYRNTTPWEGLNQSGVHLPDGTYFVVVKISGNESKELKGYLELRR